MTDQRNFGVAEARLGLTLLTCLLVALGYAILQQLGGNHAGTEVRPPHAAAAAAAAAAETSTRPTPADPQHPRVLTAQEGDPASGVDSYTARRPESADNEPPRPLVSPPR